MSAISPPAYIQASSHPADSFRRAISFAGLGQQGVRSWVAGDLLVTSNGTPNMTVNVAGGQALINGTQNTTSQGGYECLNDATVNLSIAASDPTNPRIDIVVAQVRDAAYLGANNDFILAVVTGTPAPSPAATGTPNNAIVLAQVSVAANATSVVSGNITDKRPIFGTLFHAEAYAAATHAFTSGATSTMAFDTIESDPNGNYNASTGVYTCPVAGRYLVPTGVGWASAVNSRVILDACKNGSVAKRLGDYTVGVASGGSAEVRCAASDTLSIQVTQISGGPQNAATGAAFCWVQFAYVGPN